MRWSWLRVSSNRVRRKLGRLGFGFGYEMKFYFIGLQGYLHGDAKLPNTL